MIWNCSFSQNYTNYTITDGLPSNHVYTIRQDAKGFIWFLTDKGMVKYNGTDFKPFTTKEGLPNNDVWEAFVTSDAKVWYLSKASQLGYISNDSVYAFPNAVHNEIMNPIFSYQIDDAIYLSGSLKTHQLINGKWKAVDDAMGRLKVFHSKVSRLHLYKPTNTMIVYGKTDEPIAKFEAEDFILNSKRGHITDSLYYFINTKGYCILNLNTLQLHQRPFKDQLGRDIVKYPRINLVGGTLQISGEGFVGYLDEQFNIESPFFFPKDINAHFALIDKSKTIWCASFNNGVFKIPFNKKLAKYSFLGQKVQSLDLVNQQLYASVYDDGFYVYNREQKDFNLKFKLKGYTYQTQYIEDLDATYYLSQGNAYTEANGKPLLRYNYVGANTNNKDKARKLIYHNKQLYGLFAFGLNQLDAKTFAVVKEFPQRGTNDVLSFNNTLYIATTNGLKVFENDTIVSKLYRQLLNTSILSLKQLSNNRFIINTDGFGTYIATNSELQFLKGTEFLSVKSAFVNNEELWLATNKGVLQYIENEEGFTLKTTFTTKNGLPINTVNSVAVLGQQLFVATDNGLVSLPKNSSYKSSFLDINIDEVIYNSEAILANTTKDFTANNSVNFAVSTIDFSEEKHPETFQYKLLPIQNQWQTSLTNTVNYNALKPSSYTFVVSKNGIEKSFSFTVEPLWWQRVWFRVLVGFGGASLLLYGVWLMSKRIQKRKDQKLIQEKQLSQIQLRALRSQMNPHFVFNSLSAIQYYITENDFIASETFLVKFSKLIRQFFDLSKENEISLKEEIKLLKNYLEIEKLRFRDKLDFEIKVDEHLNVEQTKIPTMLLQPIVENAVNHGVFNKVENGTVTIQFVYKDEQTFMVNIIDDGVGFENTQAEDKKHNSSRVIADRLKFLNQTHKWRISLKNEVLHNDAKDKGNKAIFTITTLQLTR